MIFVGSKVFTHARYWQIKNYVCMIFFLWGAPGGGTENLCPPPPPPRSYAPGSIIEETLNPKLTSYTMSTR